MWGYTRVLLYTWEYLCVGYAKYIMERFSVHVGLHKSTPIYLGIPLCGVRKIHNGEI